MNMKKSFLLLCGCLAIASACCNQPVKTAGINYAYMDTTARPGDDFAKYATGHWADLNPQPLEYPMWGTVTKVSDENVKALAGLIKDIADHGGLNVATTPSASSRPTPSTSNQRTGAASGNIPL